MKFGVVVFPGSNCDHDCYYVIDKLLGQPVDYVWHGSTDVAGYDCLVLPGGFAYGDYLRTGAVARFSPVMKAVEKFAAAGGFVIGICNGFQIPVSYTHLRAHETRHDLVCRLLLEKKKKQ